MDRSSGSFSSKSFGEKVRREEEDLDATADVDAGAIKMRNLESLMHSEGVVEIPVLATSEVISPVKEVRVSVLADGSFPAITRCSSASFGAKNGRFTLNNSGITQSSLKMGNEQTMEIDGATMKCSVNEDKGEKLHSSAAPSLTFDLNATQVPSETDYGQSASNNMLERVRSPESECGSTSDPLGESGPMKRWNDLKQNSFISTSYGGIPVPKPHKYQSKKRKEAELKRNLELAKKEQVSRFAKLAAPTGLLSGLNPGIINHVRNSKQVCSIIQAMVKSAKAEELQEQSDKERKESTNLVAYDEGRDHLDAERYNVSTSSMSSKSDCIAEAGGATLTEERGHNVGYRSSSFTLEQDDDSLALKLSSSGSKASDNASNGASGEYSASPETINSLSLRGANIASQWLELLHQDLRGRYAALKRSRKRVRTVIQTELPNLLHWSTYGKMQCVGQSGMDGNVENHAARWKAIFTQMEKRLNEEGKHLESCLVQVREMQSHCDMGLKYFSVTNVPFMGSSNLLRFKDAETIEREFAVMAAAASIYSTCLILDLFSQPCSLSVHSFLTQGASLPLLENYSYDCQLCM